ncbi:MAG: hypothetical protein ACI9YH_005202 [Colwellia sp.]|jgi:hypothetical protein
MKKNFIVVTILMALVSTYTLATKITPTVQASIDTAIESCVDFENCATLENAIKEAIIANPDMTESIVLAAISAVTPNSEAAEWIITIAINTVGINSSMIVNIINAALSAGVNADTITAVAVANGVDPTIASQATAVGGQSNNAIINTLTNTNNQEILINNNTGGGNGGGGISGGL